MFLALISMAVTGQSRSPQNPNFSKQMISDMGISTQRRGLAKVKRDWVNPNGFKVANFGPKNLGKFPLLDVELESNIEKAGIAIEAQGERGTCTIFATKFLVEYELARQAKFQSSVRLNPEFLNWSANAATATSGDGSSFPGVIEGLDEYGCSQWDVPKVYKPFKADFDPKYQPSDSARLKAKSVKEKVGLYQLFTHSSPGLTTKEMIWIDALLKRGVPVAVGQQWPESGAWKTQVVDGVKILDGTGPVKGAHTMAIVGYKKTAKAPGGGYFLFRNSWSEGWGYGGYHFMSFEWVRGHTYDACIAGPP